MLWCPVYVQHTYSRDLCRRRERGGGWGGHLQNQAVLPDILTSSCVCVLSPWKLGLSSTWRVLNHSPLSQTRGWCCEYGSVRSASPSRCIVSHCGREQPSFLRVRRSFAGLLYFLCLLRRSVVGVRRRLATSAAWRCWWFSCGCGGSEHLWRSVNGPCWGCLPLSVIVGHSVWGGGWAAGRWRLGRWWTELTSRWVSALWGLIRSDFVLYDDRRAKDGGRLRLWRPRGGRGDPDGGGRPRGVRLRTRAVCVMEVYC